MGLEPTSLAFWAREVCHIPVNRLWWNHRESNPIRRIKSPVLHAIKLWFHGGAGRNRTYVFRFKRPLQRQLLLQLRGGRQRSRTPTRERTLGFKPSCKPTSQYLPSRSHCRRDSVVIQHPSLPATRRFALLTRYVCSRLHPRWCERFVRPPTLSNGVPTFLGLRRAGLS